jgi:chemotaxis signal transduction protein
LRKSSGKRKIRIKKPVSESIIVPIPDFLLPITHHPLPITMINPNYNRRFRSKKELTIRTQSRKLLAFEMGREKYAIPIERVQRVIPEFRPYGVLSTGESLVRHQEETIAVIDVSKLFVSSNTETDRNYLIICYGKEKELLGIPLPEMPKILEIGEDKFGEIPESYRQNLYPAVEKLIHSPNGVEFFYLNLDKF